mgnify:CR=1 FL=1
MYMDITSRRLSRERALIHEIAHAYRYLKGLENPEDEVIAKKIEKQTWNAIHPQKRKR